MTYGPIHSVPADNSVLQMKTVLENGQKIIFIGDSITDAGRQQEAPPLGRGYVRLFADLLTIREPDKTITVVNRGIGGNTTDDLRSRWDEDVLQQRPDWLCVKIGINDLNRHLTDPKYAFLDLAAYRDIYDQVLTLTRAHLPACHILLISPFYMSRDQTPHSYRAKILGQLPAYIEVVEELSRKHATRFLNLHAVFQSHLRHRHTDSFGTEPVHPHATGALLIAEEVYRALN
ncbi:SGNH/GDSL hydrolase family protein [Rariglobus hedericola]|uniref:SGNH/GDSL hydrolase family protein n=2 Tax=Rariglobus hedericola TaxID=2597822 RepID=A0A556QPF1_9BACT|nr:SGNH/GDSL hydrolase family protein [Rariglobus hedericola]